MSAPAFEIPGYELIRELGAGGMATVFLAVQRSLDRKVAIKVMRRGLSDENVEKRFLMEGRTMARLPHPNIVGVYDIVQNESINYIAMEYLEGGMLSDRMREGLTLAEAVSVVVQVAGALQFAHDNGIVHRDLKPSNIMYRDSITPVLTDFGIARQQNSDATRLTQTGMMIGTPTYMSPEQATGSELDGRSDQYALGVLFFEMLTGHAPFEGSTPIQVVLSHLNTPPPPLPPQFSFFQPLMDRMLAKDREQRFDDLKIFVRDLKQVLTGSEALLQKLRIDPNASASEQLRALGFSESQIHTGAGQSPVPRISAQRPAPERTQSTGSGPGVRIHDPDRPRAAAARPAWLLPLIIGAVLAVGGTGTWLLMRDGRQELDPATAQLLNTQLESVDRLIGEGKLVSPPGDNAFEKLQSAMQVALKSVERYPEGEKRQATIVTLLREQAGRALATKSFDAAESRIGEALAVLPSDPDSLKLQKTIVEARISAEREIKVAELLDRAKAAQQAGRSVGEGEDNALASIRQALTVDPDSAAAKQALNSLVEQLLAPAGRAIEQGQLDAADEALQQTASYLAAEPGWTILSSRLEQARKIKQQQAYIDGQIKLARNQFRSGRIAEPAGDNVLETLQRVLEIDPANSQVAQLRGEAAAALLAEAKAAERDGDFSLAINRYDQVLQAAPSDATARQAKTALEQRVGEQRTQILRLIAAARDAIASRNFYEPAGKNAYDALRQVISQEASNAQARQLLADLPRLVREAAEDLASEGKIDVAIALLKQSLAKDPNEAKTALLASRLSGEQVKAEQAQQRDKYLSQLRAELAKRRLDSDTTAAIAGAIKQLLDLDANDAEALRYREQFTRGVSAVIASASKPSELDALAAVIEQLKKTLGETSADVKALVAEHRSRAQAVTAAESERIAALSGVLVLNATPWAAVDSVVDQSTGRAVSLPRERSTPLRLSLPQGTYRIAFKHPNVRQTVVQVATVKAKSTQTTSASFPALTSSDYLKRAGYAD